MSEQEDKTQVVDENKDVKSEASQTEEKKDVKKSNLTLEEMQVELTKARQEAARYRTGKNNAEKEKLTETERLANEIAEMKAELFSAKKLTVAMKYKLPEALADRLKGETQEELEEDAKALAALIVKPESSEAEKKPVAGIDPTAPSGTLKLTREAIEKMSPAEINKNWEAVSAALKEK